MNTQTKLPIERQTSLFSNILRSLLRTQIGKRIAFHSKLRGFNRVQVSHYQFLRDGISANKNEVCIDGKIYSSPKFNVQFNARVNVGAALQATLMSGTTFGGLSSPNHPLYIALSTSSLTPAAGDTTLSGETSVAGLGRTIGTAQNYVTPVSVDGAASYDIYHQFTLTGSNTTIVSTGLFDAASTGNLFAEVNFSGSLALVTNDILQVTWTVNI